MNNETLARRKSLLIAQSHLHRLQARMAWYDVKHVIMPPHLVPERGDRARSVAAILIRLAVPVFGLSRLGRIMRTISIGLMALRVVQGFRRRR